jgi:hypothetical protein
MLLALAALLRVRAGLPVALAATLGTLIVLGLGYRTGEAGGALVYRQGAAQAYVGDGLTSPDARAGMVAPTYHEDDD